MNIELSRNSVKASKINQEETEDEYPEIASGKPIAQNNNKEMDEARPTFEESKKFTVLQKKYDELIDKNKSLKKQLTSRDEIVKLQLGEIQRLKQHKIRQLESTTKLKTRNDHLEKEVEAEKWLSEKLKQDIRDLQLQLGFEECYLQEQTSQMGLMESLLRETQKKYHAQSEEINELKQQLDKAKQRLDNQILDLQNILAK